MEHLLIINEVADLMFLEIIEALHIEKMNLVSLSISKFKQNLSNLEQYEEKKNIFLEIIKAEKFDQENFILLREKLVRKKMYSLCK